MPLPTVLLQIFQFLVQLADPVGLLVDFLLEGSCDFELVVGALFQLGLNIGFIDIAVLG